MSSRVTLPELERTITRVATRMYSSHMVAGHWGNVTAVADDGTILATPDWMSLGDVGERDLIRVDRSGQKLSGNGRPFFELPMHMAVYRGRPDAGAVVHAHPRVASTFAAANTAIDGRFSPEFTFMTGGIVPVVSFAMPGTETLSVNLSACLQQYDVVLLEKHGILAWACSPVTALALIEQVEEIATILMNSSSVGKIEPLKPEILRLIEESRTRAGLGPSGRDRKK